MPSEHCSYSNYTYQSVGKLVKMLYKDLFQEVCVRNVVQRSSTNIQPMYTELHGTVFKIKVKEYTVEGIKSDHRQHTHILTH